MLDEEGREEEEGEKHPSEVILVSDSMIGDRSTTKFGTSYDGGGGKIVNSEEVGSGTIMTVS